VNNIGNKKNRLARRFSVFWWRWRESNPRLERQTKNIYKLSLFGFLAVQVENKQKLTTAKAG